MANEKANKPDQPKKLEIPTRVPSKKPSIFANIGTNRSTEQHPLRDILNFPADVGAHHSEDVASTASLDRRPQPSHGDAHTVLPETPTSARHGRPPQDIEGVHTTEHETPTTQERGRPLLPSRDAHSLPHQAPTQRETRRPRTNQSDAHSSLDEPPTSSEMRRPPPGNVDAKAPVRRSGAPTGIGAEGAQAPSLSDVGAHKPGRRGDRHNNPSTERLALRPNAEILKKIKHYCVEQGYTLTTFFELAGLHFMDVGAHHGESSGAQAPQDNRRLMMLFKTRPAIINLYLAYTSRFNEHGANAGAKWSGKWLPRDDEAAARFNDLDIRIVELGIIQTQANKGIGNGKIQTFQYYVGEIESTMAAELSENTLDIMIKHHRQTLNRWFGREVDLSFLEATDG